jgi:hypothetical protein
MVCGVFGKMRRVYIVNKKGTRRTGKERERHFIGLGSITDIAVGGEVGGVGETVSLI